MPNSRLHDLDNRLTGETHQPSSDPDMVYNYDAKDRLTQADNALWSGAVNYGYDFGDNRTSKTWNTDGWQNAYASTSNRLSSITPVVSGVAGTPVSVSMDAMGNTVSDGLRTFSYDATDRMVSVSNGGSGASYLVNAEGLRVRKSVSGIGATNEIVAYDDMRRRVGVYQANGSGGFTVKEELVYLPGSWRLVATVRGQVPSGSDGVAYPVLSDQIGTPRVVLDPTTGDRRWSWTAKEAFGLQAPNENPDSLTAGNFVFDARFPGQFLDAESGLFHNGYRDYDAKVGRYVESDPLGLGAGWNTYGYAGGNPTQYTDALGLTFGFAPGTSQSDKLLYNKAQWALFAIPGFGQKYMAMARDTTILYTINMDYHKFELANQTGYYDTKTKTINWNPRLGVEYLEGGCAGYLSPAEILGHELMHPYLTKQGYPINAQEQRIIDTYERDFSAVYGGTARKNHRPDHIHIIKTEDMTGQLQ